MSLDPDPQLPDTAVRFLRVLLSEYPAYPAVALWRSWESALFARLRLEGPLLDVGCGDGRILERLLANPEAGTQPLPAIGLDVNWASASMAASRDVYAGVVLADARRLPLATSKFGAAVSICVLEHIPGVAHALAEVARVLRPGGLFAFSVPTPGLLQIAAETHPGSAEGYVREFCERVEHRNTWSLARWEEALADNGLQIREALGFMPSGAARAWFAAYDWTVRPIRGRGPLYRAAGANLRRFGVGRVLAAYWFRRLRQAAADGVEAPLDEASAALIVATKPDPA